MRICASVCASALMGALLCVSVAAAVVKECNVRKQPPHFSDRTYFVKVKDDVQLAHLS